VEGHKRRSTDRLRVMAGGGDLRRRGGRDLRHRAETSGAGRERNRGGGVDCLGEGRGGSYFTSFLVFGQR